MRKLISLIIGLVILGGLVFVVVRYIVPIIKKVTGGGNEGTVQCELFFAAPLRTDPEYDLVIE